MRERTHEGDYEMGELKVAPWITPGAELLTRCGLRARIYAVDCGGEYPAHGAIFARGVWEPVSWDAEGWYFDPENHDYDLAKPVRHKKVYVLLGESGRLYFREEPEDVLYGERIIASKRVELIEGIHAPEEGEKP